MHPRVSTVAGVDSEWHQDGAAAQAMFGRASGLALLSDGRVLVPDGECAQIRMLSADWEHVSTVWARPVGATQHERQDGPVAQAHFDTPRSTALLADGRVLVADNNCIRVITALCAACLGRAAAESWVVCAACSRQAAWLRRRELLMCLRAPPRAPDVLLRLPALSDGLMASIFQFL